MIESRITWNICYSGSYNYQYNDDPLKENWTISSVSLESRRFKILAPINVLQPSYQWQFLSFELQDEIDNLFKESTQQFACSIDAMKEMKVFVNLSKSYKNANQEEINHIKRIFLTLEIPDLQDEKELSIEIIHGEEGFTASIKKNRPITAKEIHLKLMSTSQLEEILIDTGEKISTINSTCDSITKSINSKNGICCINLLLDLGFQKDVLSEKISDINELLKHKSQHKNHSCSLF